MTRNPLKSGAPPVAPWRPVAPRRRCTATAVLLTGPLGALRLYTRWGPGQLKCVGTISSPSHLGAQLRELPRPRTIILCGRRHLSDLASLVLPRDDLHLVPLHWLDHVPREDLQRRAALAARFVSAQRRGAIECLFGNPQMFFPF